MSKKIFLRLSMIVILASGVSYAWWYAQSNQNDTLFSASGPSAPAIPLSTYYQEALVDYQSGAYNDAIEHLESHLAVHPDHTEATFLLGLSCLEIGEESRTIRLMDEVRINDPGYYLDATWYMGLACLKDDQPQFARRLMEELSTGQDSFYRAKAKVILNRFL